MFDIGWTELLVIGVVALIVGGPKDLPGMFRTLGRFTAKARSMARDFSRAMEDAADEAGVKDVAKDLKKSFSVTRIVKVCFISTFNHPASKKKKNQYNKNDFFHGRSSIAEIYKSFDSAFAHASIAIVLAAITL